MACGSSARASPETLLRTFHVGQEWMTCRAFGTPLVKKKLSFSSKINLLLYRGIFGILRRIRPPVARPIALTSQSRVLIFSSAGLGDSLLDSVAIRALAETFSGIQIEAVVHHRRPDISQHNPFLKKLHLLKKGPPRFLSLWWELRKGAPWDAVFYLCCHDPEARCLGFLLNRDATVSLAWRTSFSDICAWNLTNPALRSEHLAQQSLRVVEVAGATTKYPRMVYTVQEADRQALDEKLASLGLPTQPSVVFQLGGGGAAYRDWPVEFFFALAQMLHATGEFSIFILGGKDHRWKADRFAELAKAAAVPFYDVVGKLSLPMSAALLERSRCLVSTDTGIMHLGFALGTPTVAILHCTPGRALVGPLADEDQHALLEIPTPPNYDSPSDAPMSSLSPETVFPHLQRLLNRSAL